MDVHTFIEDFAKNAISKMYFEQMAASTKLIKMHNAPTIRRCYTLLSVATRCVATRLALLVKQVDDAEFTLDDVDAVLVVVEVNERPLDLLSHVLFLFQLKDVLQRARQLP